MAALMPRLWIRLGEGEPRPCRMVPLVGSGGHRWRIQLEGGTVVLPSEPHRITGGLDSARAMLAVSGYRCA